jgi:AcrR family transcriptional regulator
LTSFREKANNRIRTNVRLKTRAFVKAIMAASGHMNGNGRRPSTSRRPSESYDRKLEAILRQAAAVFRTRGYHQASIRDIARATGVSLAGLYYYFSSKEELLFLIQRHAFETILAAAKEGLRGLETPEERLRALIRLHLQFFLDHPNEMKVLTHEEEWLSKERGREVRAIKRVYYQLCFAEVQALKETCGRAGLDTRLAVLSLFGMMNWIYTWYNPKIDPDAQACAKTMADIFLKGILSGPVDKLSMTGPEDVLAQSGDALSPAPRSPNGGSARVRAAQRTLRRSPITKLKETLHGKYSGSSNFAGAH